MPDPTKLLASYGRRRGRKLRPVRQGLMDELLPELQLSLEDTKMRGYEDVKNLFPHILTSSHLRIFLEIGFGGGEHLAHQATLHPDVGIIGCEPFINGVAGLLSFLAPPLRGSRRDQAVGEGRVVGGSTSDAESPPTLRASSPTETCAQPLFLKGGAKVINNIRIFQGDARLLIEKLPDHCLDKVFILYPDPWPKARHHKRRLVSSEFLHELARVMKSGAELRLATDDEDYLTWMLERLLSHPSFEWTAKDCDDWQKPWPDWISTRYEQKALKAGRKPTYLTFIKK